jgi:hypothetical protein
MARKYEVVIMDSLHTLALGEEELLSVAYDEGTLSDKEREHLEHCSICQQRLASYTHTNDLLRTKLYRRLCPSAVQLNYYCLGMVSAEKRISIASHLLDCPLCADEVVEIRRLQATFDPFPAAPFSLRASVRRLLATLVVHQAQPVTRDIGPSLGWPRQYRADMIDLSLHLSRAANGEMMLLGIITSIDPTATVDIFEGVSVDLYQAPGTLVTESEGDQASDQTLTPYLSNQVDDVGNILLEPVPTGNYVMIVHLPDLEVVIEGLNIDHK